MTVRDLGYRAYEGALRPPSDNTWVLLRYGLWRIWGSWINRLAVVIGILLPTVVFGVFDVVRWQLAQMNPQMAEQWNRLDPAPELRSVVGMTFWFFVTVITMRSGAGVIAEDFTNRAYQFYFAKPVTPIQYLIGRASALAIFVFAVVVIPTTSVALLLANLGPDEDRMERLGLVLPAILDAAIIAVTCSILSIAVSALSKSRALTMTAWALLLLAPFVLASLVEGITDAEWVFLASPPGLLWILGDALFKVHERWEHVEWYHALPVLVALNAGGVFLALSRIRKAEVIT
jgi:ABC-2 type transport system permease protein